MIKVICGECQDIGYTASPDYVLCECGGRLTALGDVPGELKKREVMKMQVLLILKSTNNMPGARVLVSVQKEFLKKKVVSLLAADKDREAFDLLIKKAEVEAYLPPGQKARIRPAVTLIEDLL